MSDWVSILATEVLTNYESWMQSTWDNFLQALFWLLVIKIVFELLIKLFPSLQGIAYVIFTPFRVLHVWFHVQAAKNIANKKSKHVSPSENLYIGLSFRTGFGVRGEGSSVSFLSRNQNDLTVRETLYIANAPMLPALAILVSLILLAPLMAQGFFIIFHLYFLLGTAWVLMPTTNDRYFIFNAIITKTTVSAWYLVNPLLVFALTASLYIYKYDWLGDYPAWWWLEPIVMGLWSVWLYFTFLILILVLTPSPKKPKRTYSYFSNTSRQRPLNPLNRTRSYPAQELHSINLNTLEDQA